MTQLPYTLNIPANLRFEEFRLGVAPDGHVTFDWTPFERLYEASGVPVETLWVASEQHIVRLLVFCYDIHLRRGGLRHPIAETLRMSVALEDFEGPEH
ncbi:MAG: hypothetical protein LBR22_05270 [Desulfovibrio sp.]|nr:hypothetical protein [Desulfovibrio sp.]